MSFSVQPSATTALSTVSTLPFCCTSLTAQALINLQNEARIDRTNTPNAFQHYFPVPTKSFRQSTFEIQQLGTIDPSQYATLGFSSSFIAIYGEPTSSYSDFRRLMTTPFDHELLPKIRKFATLLEQDSRFLWCCQTVDDLLRVKGAQPVGRREMEAMWECVAVARWEKHQPEEGKRKNLGLLKKVCDMVDSLF